MTITSRHSLAIVLLATTSLVPLTTTVLAQAEVPLLDSEVTLLDEVLVQATAGSKRAVAVSEVPQSVSVVSREQLDKQPGAKADETLGYTAGVTPMTYGTDADTDWFAIRGFQADQTGVFLDGLSLYQIGFATVLVDPFLLEQIEVLKGPSSGLYGGASVGGIVNYVSKRPTGEPLRYTETGINSHGNAYLGVDFGDATESGDLAYRLTAKVSGGGWETEGAEDLRGNILGSVTWTPTDATELTVYGSYQNVDLDHTATGFLPYYGTVEDSAEGFRIPRGFNYGEPDIDVYEREQVMLGYELEHQIDETWTVRQFGRLASVDVNEDGIYPWGSYDSTAPTELQRYRWAQHSQATIGTIDTQLEGNFETGTVEHSLLLGFDYKNYRHDPETYFASATDIDIFDPIYGTMAYTAPDLTQQTITTMQQAGLYAQDQIKWDNWLLTLNGRYDYARTELEGSAPALREEGVFSGRAGIGYAFDNGLTPYASYTTSFLPQLAQSPTQELLPSETGQQWEVGVKYEPDFINGIFTAALFSLDRSNVAAPNPVPVDGFYGSDPVGEVNVKGAELEALFNFDNFGVRGALTYLDAEIIDSNDAALIGQTPVQVPKLTASLAVEYHFDDVLDGLTMGAGVRYLGESWADSANTLEVPAATVFDASLRYDAEDWGVALNVSNILDTTYVASCQSATSCGYGAGREVRVSFHRNW